MQYTKPSQQYEIPTIPTVVISKVLLPQSNIIAAFVYSKEQLTKFAATIVSAVVVVVVVVVVFFVFTT